MFKMQKNLIQNTVYITIFIAHLKVGLMLVKNHIGLNAASTIFLCLFSILLLVYIVYLNSTLKPMEFSLVTKGLIGIQLVLIFSIICNELYNIHLNIMVILQEVAKFIAVLSPVFTGIEFLT